MIVVYTAAATEPVSISEVMPYVNLDESNQEPAPGVITFALASPAIAGNVDNGAHRYLATFVTASGETQAGTVSEAVTVANKAVNGKVELTAIPTGGALVTSRKIYRTVAGGSTYLLLATIANNTATTYTDNIADASLGAGAPSTNTTTDPLLSIIISSVRALAEQELRRYLITQTLDAYFDAFPRDWMYGRGYDCKGSEIRLPPLQSVTEITYVDTDGDTQTLAADQYLVDAVSQPARILPAYGLDWPSTRAQSSAVKVRFVAGYGVASAVPACIKNWMLLKIATAWENRSELVIGPSGMVRLPQTYVDSLLDPERVMGWI